MLPPLREHSDGKGQRLAVLGVDCPRLLLGESSRRDGLAKGLAFAMRPDSSFESIVKSIRAHDRHLHATRRLEAVLLNTPAPLVQQ
jgi:hypothetical protein